MIGYPCMIGLCRKHDIQNIGYCIKFMQGSEDEAEAEKRAEDIAFVEALGKKKAMNDAQTFASMMEKRELNRPWVTG